MAKKPETKLQKKIRNALEEEYGGFWYKTSPGHFQMIGLPDLIGCVGGLFIGFEVKTPKGEVSKIQDKVGSWILGAGGCWSVIYSVDEALNLMRLWNIPLKQNSGRSKKKLIKLR